MYLTNRTEFSFRVASGKVPAVLAQQPDGAAFAGITDRHGTWGHVAWDRACRKAGLQPVFGVELACVPDSELREKQPTNHVRLLAMDREGLRAIYGMVTAATERFYFVPRIDYGLLHELPAGVAVLLGDLPHWDHVKRLAKPNWFCELSPTTRHGDLLRARESGIRLIASTDNYYPHPADRAAYEMIVGPREAAGKSTPVHIPSADEWLEWVKRMSGADDQVIRLARGAAFEIGLHNVELEVATLPETHDCKSLYEWCMEGAVKKGVDMTRPEYAQRLDRELKMIREKGFEQYFYIVADLVRYAKTVMLVGPARGSSCGSLACYLLDITEIDPIPHNLLFERFIDITRSDLPDIDIDFSDTHRHLVMEYLQQKYGHGCVAHVGTISEFKPKSALTDVARYLGIPVWEIEDLKGAIIERSGGDSRANLCLTDTFDSLDIAKTTLAKFPQFGVCAAMEGAARHTGVHAAGIIVTQHPLSNYCSVDERTNTIQLDKDDAEKLGMLKIDVLGLRTLSVIQDTMDAIGWTYSDLVNHPLTDQAAFDIINNRAYSGIFQFEGYALQSISSQVRVTEFEHIVALTALGRPGPLASGGTNAYLQRMNGAAPVTYLHPTLEPITRVTYGIVVFQEQVMEICRGVGHFDWVDTSMIRKCMSKTMGIEFFDQYWKKFKVGAAKEGIGEEMAKTIWDNINTMGSWAFNRSHAVAYAMISYWCCVLKSRYPLEFAAACLRNAKDDDQSLAILRELVGEGYRYKAYDADKSELGWSIQDGMLVGGLTGVKGIGPKLAQDILAKRANGKPLTKRQRDLLTTGTTPWDIIFEGRELWGHILDDPARYNIQSHIWPIATVDTDTECDVLILAKLKEKRLRDANEAILVEKRGGKEVTGQTAFLNLTVEDDTGSIICNIPRHKYLEVGKPIIESGKVGDWYLIKGRTTAGFRLIFINRVKKLTNNADYAKPLKENETEHN